MTTVASTPAPTSCNLGEHTWDLKYGASALRALQMKAEDPFQLSAELIGKSPGEGFSEEKQALLIWAGQRAVEPKLKLGRVKQLLRDMHPLLRSLLLKWAIADFCTAIFRLAEAQMAAAQRAANTENDEESDEAL